MRRKQQTQQMTNYGYVCNYCQKCFYDVNIFKYHVKEGICAKLKELRGEILDCSYCENIFENASDYITHVDLLCTNVTTISEPKNYAGTCPKCNKNCLLQSTLLYHKLFSCSLNDLIKNQDSFSAGKNLIPFGAVTSLYDYVKLIPGIEKMIRCAIFDREGETIQYLTKCINCSVERPEFHNIYIDGFYDKRLCKVFNGKSFILMRRSKVFELHIENLVNLVNEYIELYHEQFSTSEGKEKIKIYNTYIKDVVYAKPTHTAKERVMETDMIAIFCTASLLQKIDQTQSNLRLPRKRIYFTWDDIAMTILKDVNFFADLLRCIPHYKKKNDAEAIHFILENLSKEYVNNNKFLPFYIPMLRIEHELEPNWDEELFYNYFANKCYQRIDIYL